MRINPPDEHVVSQVNAPAITPFLPDPGKATGAVGTEFNAIVAANPSHPHQ
jgi:hypothetical protein